MSFPESKHAWSVAVLLGGFGAVGVTIAFAAISGRPPDHFTRDPLSIADAPAYVGFLSNIGVAAWFSAAAIAWCAAIVLRSGDATARARSNAMVAVAAMLCVLACDDLFMLHEETLQRHMGISEKLTLAVYALIAGAIALRFRATWWTTSWGWIVFAGVMFAASIAVDFATSGFGWRLVIEDSFKFMGIVGILAWLVVTAQQWLKPRDQLPGREP